MIRRIAAAAFALIAWQPAHASCLDGTSTCKLTLQQDSTPQEQPWTQPARIAYTFNNDGADSFAVDIATKAVIPLKTSFPLFLLADASWHKDNQQKKEQNNLQVSGGLHLEFQSAPPVGAFDKSRLWSVAIDGKLGYNRKGVFADRSKPACVADPSLIVCNTQYVGSIRGTIDVSPVLGFFESSQSFTVAEANGSSTGTFDGPPVAHSFGLIGTFFYDNATENTLDPDTGKRITGVVTGFKTKVGGAISPRFTGYRVVLRADVQGVWAVSRADFRKDDFAKSSHLVTVSVDWDLADRSFQTDRRGVKPSVGVTYTNGADPLVGKDKQSTWVVGFKLAFK